MQLVTISGLDGSGKTTQLKKFNDYLIAKEKRVYHFHMIEFSIANKFLSFQKRNYSRPSKAITTANAFAIILRKIALVIDTVRFNQFFAKLANDYDYLLTDRYFYDQIVNIHYLENSIETKKHPQWQKIAEKFIKTPALGIFLEVSPEIAISRDRDIEQGKQFLIDKQKIFNKFIPLWKIEKINGAGTANEVFAKILNKANLPTL